MSNSQFASTSDTPLDTLATSPQMQTVPTKFGVDEIISSFQTLPDDQLPMSVALPLPVHIPGVECDNSFPSLNASPISSNETTLVSRKTSEEDITATDHIYPSDGLERATRRISSAFFVYFSSKAFLLRVTAVGLFPIFTTCRFDFTSSKRSWYPRFTLTSVHRSSNSEKRNTHGYSPSQAQAFALVAASIFQACFFVIIGTSTAFGSALVAFGFATFARAFLTDQQFMKANYCLGSIIMILPKNFEWCTHPVLSDKLFPTHWFGLSRFFKACMQGGDNYHVFLLTPLHIDLRRSVVSETVTQAFAVVFLLGQRTANPNTVGYVNSGFWAGMAISRIGLGCIYRRMSSRAVKHLLHCNLCLSPKLLPIGISLIIALVFHILVWQIPSLTAGFVFTSAIGLIYGPVFPLGVSLSTRMLPSETHMTSMAVMSTVANIGNALFPFTAGILINDISTKTYRFGASLVISTFPSQE
ncbi:hypothetical protein BU17DRAFT_61377 [Hysterangium stoloniferum]|nr:hypothetical protein BU17DRAFT_61377 [Hysterangium stoloniferum]